MNQSHFKVLTRAQTFVDYGLLMKGIYTTDRPRLLDASSTIVILEVQIQSLVEKRFINQQQADTAIANLRQCQLVDVQLTII